MKAAAKVLHDQPKVQKPAETKEKVLTIGQQEHLKSHRVIARHRGIFQSSLPELNPDTKRSTSRPVHSDQNLVRKKIIHKKASSSSANPNPSTSSPTFETFSFHSIRGQIPYNRQKANQDSFIVCPDLSLKTFLFGVADGHGPEGEFISSYIKSRFPSLVLSSPFFSSSLEKSMVQSIQKLSQEVHHQAFDSSFSGSTLVSAILRGSDMVCVNVGDSRAILGRKSLNKPWKTVVISTDHKPALPEENTRIQAKGGRVQPLVDFFGMPVGPPRVWVKSHQYPGLAMSRSIGDKVAQNVGVSAQPDVFKRKLQLKDKFLVLASDGIFDVLDNQVVVKIVADRLNCQNYNNSALYLAETAKEKWKDIGEKVDDITCVVVFFNWSVNN